MNKMISPTQPINLLEIIGNAVVGGMETYVANLIRRLPPERFRVTCLCPFESRFTAELRELGCKVLIVPITDDPTWESIQVAVTVVRTHAISLIHAHLANAHILAGLTGKITSVPVLATVHGRQMPMLDLEIHRMAETHLSVVCQTAHLHALAMGVRSDRLHLIPNGVDSAAVRSGAKSPWLHALLQLPVETPLVGYVGRLSWEKGPDVFLRMAWAARQTRPDLHFVLVGEGPIMQLMQETSAALGLQGFVHFAGQQSAMAEVYASLDLMVMSSHSEGMPLALLEAMAAGLATVSTRVGGVGEIVVVGTTGLVVNAADHEAMARAVVNLMKQPQLRATMGAAARQRVERHFSLQKTVVSLADLLSSLAQSRENLPERRLGAVPLNETAPVKSNGKLGAAQVS